MTGLGWPIAEDEPLPATSELDVVGWKEDNDAVICVRVLHHEDNALLQHIMNQQCVSGGLSCLEDGTPKMTAKLGQMLMFCSNICIDKSIGPLVGRTKGKTY